MPNRIKITHSRFPLNVHTIASTLLKLKCIANKGCPVIEKKIKSVRLSVAILLVQGYYSPAEFQHR
jgi:hypothetical protein